MSRFLMSSFACFRQYACTKSSTPAPGASQGNDDAEEAEDGDNRLFSKDAKLDMFQCMLEWKENGSKRAESPIADLVRQYKCHRTYRR